MFGPRKNDPLVNIATSVMKEGDLRRGAEKLTNETLGVFSRRQLPHERHAEYDALLVQNVDQALGKAKTLTEDTQPVPISETRHQTLERFIREQKKENKETQLDEISDRMISRFSRKAFAKMYATPDRKGKEKRFKQATKGTATLAKRHGWANVSDVMEKGRKADLKEDDTKEVKAEKQKREIMKWYDRSHRKPGAEPRDPNQGDLFKNGKKKLKEETDSKGRPRIQFEPGETYHTEFADGDRVYFRPLTKQKNGRWHGHRLDHPKFGKPKQSSADDMYPPFWTKTPHDEVPKKFKEFHDTVKKDK